MDKSRKRIAQDYARNAIKDGNTKAGKYEKRMAVKEAAGEGPSQTARQRAKLPAKVVAAIAAKKGPSQIKKMTKEKKIQVTKKMVANAKKLPKRGKSTKDLEKIGAISKGLKTQSKEFSKLKTVVRPDSKDTYIGGGVSGPKQVRKPVEKDKRDGKTRPQIKRKPGLKDPTVTKTRKTNKRTPIKRSPGTDNSNPYTKDFVGGIDKTGVEGKTTRRPKTKVKNQVFRTAGPKMKGPYMESNAQERSNLLNDNPIASRASGGSWMSKHIHRM